MYFFCVCERFAFQLLKKSFASHSFLCYWSVCQETNPVTQIECLEIISVPFQQINRQKTKITPMTMKIHDSRNIRALFSRAIMA